MNWTQAITRNRDDLLQLLASVFVTLGLTVGSAVTVLPRHAWLDMLRRVRIGEAVARRLITIAARNLSVTLPERRNMPSCGVPRGKGKPVPAFVLIDPRRRVGPVEKRVSGFGPNVRYLDEMDVPVPERREVSPDDMLDASRLLARAQALRAALDDIPGQARRLARMMARRAAAGRPPIRPMRPGRPPGHRDRPTDALDELLADCQELALMALAPDTPDTS